MIDIQKPTDVAIMTIHGNDAGAYFGVTGFDTNGEQTDLFVNTTDPYTGTVLVDAKEGQQTTRLQVQATGGWTVEIKPLVSARTAQAPGTVTGTGDDVIIIQGSPSTAHITGNQSGRYFGVFGYSDRIQLLVNVTDPYDGKVVVSSKTKLIEVKATGDWTIEFQ